MQAGQTRNLIADQMSLQHARLLAVHGTCQAEGMRSLIAGHLEDLTPLLGRLTTESRDFH